ncbi:hypothetical protein ABK040_001999 [Willaertia magna]
MLIRVRGKDGTFRFEVNDMNTTTINDLKLLVEKETKVPSNSITLKKFRENNSLLNNSTLQQCNIKHGDMLEFTYDVNQFKSKQDEEEEIKKKKRAEEMTDDDIENLGLKHRTKQITLKEYVDLVNKVKVTIKHQKYAICSSVEIDQNAGQNFQLFLRQTRFQMQRFGFLYGTTAQGKKPQPTEEEKKSASKDEYFNEDDDHQDAFVKVIYEPKQESYPDGFKELEDPIYNDRADALASMLGLKKVGWIFSHDGQREYPLLGPEIIKAAEYQSKFGPSFVTVTVSPNEEGEIIFEAFQVSKQCVQLWEKGWLEIDPENPDIIKVKKAVEVERKMVNTIDVLLLVTNVAIKNHKSIFQFGFPPRNRPGNEHLQTMQELKSVLLERKSQKFVQRVSDFNLLLFLTDYLSLTSDFPDLCEAVLTQNNSMATGFEALINAYCGIE